MTTNIEPFSGIVLNSRANVDIRQPNIAIFLLPNLLHNALATGPKIFVIYYKFMHSPAINYIISYNFNNMNNKVTSNMINMLENLLMTKP